MRIAEVLRKKGTEVAQACLQTMAYLRKLASPTLATLQQPPPALAEAVTA